MKIKKVVVTGGSGKAGRATIKELLAHGYDVRNIDIAPPREPISPFQTVDLMNMGEVAEALSEADAVVHLAGENIASGRWTAARRAAIRESRVTGTRLLAEGIGGLSRPPATLVCASAVGYYGDRGDERLTESSSAGRGFLAEVCQAWEAAAAPAAAAGVRVAHLRFGVILAASGGALARMLLPFRLGVGGRLVR